MQLDPRLL